MKDFIIDLNNIPYSTYNDNISYFKFNSIIPINSIYKLYMKPYYINSPYLFRDIYSNFDDLLEDIKIYKPRSNKTYNMDICYIPQKPLGQIINNEIIPVKSNLYNVINKPYYIKEINTFDHNIDFEINKNLYLNIEPLKKNRHVKDITFFPYDLNINKYFTSIKWKPINNFIIDYNSYYEIDISNFVDKNFIRDNEKIPSFKKILIICSYI